MTGFLLQTANLSIRFKYYTHEAPETCKTFDALLPFKRTFMHARVSGQEIWIDDAPPLHAIQENASVFTNPGEVVYGPANATRAKTVNCMGIYYGEGKGLDTCNIFACVFDEDRELLTQLGESIWKHGVQELSFRKI
jgi:hypothetical protein